MLFIHGRILAHPQFSHSQPLSCLICTCACTCTCSTVRFWHIGTHATSYIPSLGQLQARSSVLFFLSSAPDQTTLPSYLRNCISMRLLTIPHRFAEFGLIIRGSATSNHRITIIPPGFPSVTHSSKGPVSQSLGHSSDFFGFGSVLGR